MNPRTFFWPMAEQILPFPPADARGDAHAGVADSNVAPPQLVEPAVHVWAWDLDIPLTPLNWEILNEEETLRARRFVFPRDRDRYARAHAVMRTLLGSYVSEPPEKVPFSSSRYGKPQLQKNQTRQDIRFNLSHSAGVGVLAVSQGYEVGIDIEVVRPIDKDVAEGHFSRQELATLQTLPPEEWLQGFYRCWTSKEALLKGEGLGLNLPLDAFDVEADPHRPPALLGCRPPESIASGWLLIDLKPAPDAVCTLAVRDDTSRFSADFLRFFAVNP